MNKKLRGIVVGDVHGRYDSLNHIIKTTRAKEVFVCGDFGIWPNKKGMDANIDDLLCRLPNRKVKIYWTPGNHDWWDGIEEVYGRYGNKPIEMREGTNIFYCPIGSVLKYNFSETDEYDDFKNILFLGGAMSVDKEYRTPKKTWWEQEEFTYDDAFWVKENVKDNIDIIISHTCPKHFFYHKDFFYRKDFYLFDKKEDASSFFLGEMLEYFNPKKWYFGHWHMFLEGEVHNCKWMCLNMIYLKRCYTKLKLVK